MYGMQESSRNCLAIRRMIINIRTGKNNAPEKRSMHSINLSISTEVLLWRKPQNYLTNRNEARCSVSLTECGVVGEHYSTPCFHPRHQHPPSRNDPAKPRTAWVRLNCWVRLHPFKNGSDLTMTTVPALSRCSCIGPRASGAPRHGVWVDFSFLPDTPWAW